MKISAPLIVAFGAVSVSAFAPASNQRAFVVGKTGNVARMPSMFMTEKSLDDMTMEEEVEMLTKQEMTKMKRASNLRNENGVEFAPWMGISAEDEAKIKQVVKERAVARRIRQEEERDVSGNLYADSQGQELGGLGLKTKVIDGEVELEWATQEETDTKGFVIKRRPAKTTEFSVIASYDDWGPLQSKGAEGGVYRYLDTTVSPGGWVYRITECDTAGDENDICQVLLEVQTQEEEKASLFAAVGIVAFGVIALAGGVLLDPMNGY